MIGANQETPVAVPVQNRFLRAGGKEGGSTGAAYFGPGSGRQKGRNLAASTAMDGEASVAEGMPLSHRRLEPMDQF